MSLMMEQELAVDETSLKRGEESVGVGRYCGLTGQKRELSSWSAVHQLEGAELD